MTMNSRGKLLWIPRSLLILVGMFYLFIVQLCLINQHNGLAPISLTFLVLVIFLFISFFLSTISGVVLSLYSIYLFFSAKGFNSFIYYPIIILLLAGILMTYFSIFLKTNTSLKSRELVQAKTSKTTKASKITGYLMLGMFSCLILFAIMCVTFASNGTARGFSMNPTIHNNALVLINRIAYQNFNPKRGDIIEFNLVQVSDNNLIKRVIGIPGDTIEWKDYHIYLNGKELIEPHQFDSFTKTYKQTNEFPSVTLKEDEYFVMGDNRMVSYDARHFDPIKREDILGKVYFIYNPPEE